MCLNYENIGVSPRDFYRISNSQSWLHILLFYLYFIFSKTTWHHQIHQIQWCESFEVSFWHIETVKYWLKVFIKMQANDFVQHPIFVVDRPTRVFVHVSSCSTNFVTCVQLWTRSNHTCTPCDHRDTDQYRIGGTKNVCR